MSLKALITDLWKDTGSLAPYRTSQTWLLLLTPVWCEPQKPWRTESIIPPSLLTGVESQILFWGTKHFTVALLLFLFWRPVPFHLFLSHNTFLHFHQTSSYKVLLLPLILSYSNIGGFRSRLIWWEMNKKNKNKTSKLHVWQNSDAENMCASFHTSSLDASGGAWGMMFKKEKEERGLNPWDPPTSAVGSNQ